MARAPADTQDRHFTPETFRLRDGQIAASTVSPPTFRVLDSHRSPLRREHWPTWGTATKYVYCLARAIHTSFLPLLSVSVDRDKEDGPGGKSWLMGMGIKSRCQTCPYLRPRRIQ